MSCAYAYISFDITLYVHMYILLFYICFSYYICLWDTFDELNCDDKKYT